MIRLIDILIIWIPSIVIILKGIMVLNHMSKQTRAIVRIVWLLLTTCALAIILQNPCVESIAWPYKVFIWLTAMYVVIDRRVEFL